MRSWTSELLNAQKAASQTPYVKVDATNRLCGAVNLAWMQIRNGSEPDGPCAIAISGNYMIRLRAGPVADSRKLYRQRVTSPGPGADFSLWTDTGITNVASVASCADGANVSLFYIREDDSTPGLYEIWHQESSDYGATWGAAVLLEHAPTEFQHGCAAAYNWNGDIALFIADQDTLYLMQRTGGSWSALSAWSPSGAPIGELAGVATCYDGDWRLIVSGQDSDDNYRVWSLVYGDGEEIAAGAWTELKTITASPAGEDYQFTGLALDCPDTYRCFFIEKYTGNLAYSWPFFSHTVVNDSLTAYRESRWREPVPFPDQYIYSGIALAHNSQNIFFSTSSDVWYAPLAEQYLDLTEDVLSAKLDLQPEGGQLTIELRNDDGRYTNPAIAGGLPILDNSIPDSGCQIGFSPGYLTSSGPDWSEGLSFTVESYEYTSAGGKASLILYSLDGWAALERWSARYSMRWNATGDNDTVQTILAFVLARAGINLEVSAQGNGGLSSLMTGFYPDFTIHPGDDGRSVVKELLSFVPELLFIEGNTAYLYNPHADDATQYVYGAPDGGGKVHPILEARYRMQSWPLNRVKALGDNSGSLITTETLNWTQIARTGDRLAMIGDANLHNTGQAYQRGSAILAKAGQESGGGYIRTPVNCFQQLYDIIEVTDMRAGKSGERRRVSGIRISYLPARGQYEQVLGLGEWVGDQGGGD